MPTKLLISTKLRKIDMDMPNYSNVEVVKRANVYEGVCISHTVIFADGSKKSLGVILPGAVSLPTQVNEVFEIQGGRCDLRIVGLIEWRKCGTGDSIEFPPGVKVDFVVHEAVDYICHFGAQLAGSQCDSPERSDNTRAT